MTIQNTKALKEQLFQALKSSDALTEYADAIFSDTNGEIFQWATSDGDESNAPETARDALQQYGVAIVVCASDKRSVGREIPNNTVREARFPVLVLTNCQVENAPDPQDVVDDVEVAVMDIAKSDLKRAWGLDETTQYGKEAQNYVVFAVHEYVI